MRTTTSACLNCSDLRSCHRTSPRGALNQALIEKKMLALALNLHEGVKSQAAKYLNINRTTLTEKMKRLGF